MSLISQMQVDGHVEAPIDVALLCGSQQNETSCCDSEVLFGVLGWARSWTRSMHFIGVLLVVTRRS